MTYDDLYWHVLNYVAMPDTSIAEYITMPGPTITEHDKRRACLILDAFMEFILDCTDAGIDPRTLDMNGIINEKLDEIGA